MRTLVDMTFGSHLYGTHTIYSDRDWKAVHLPSPVDILRCHVPKSLSYSTKMDASERNKPGDIDKESYALHYFLELAAAGETVALDMLHAPSSAWELVTPEWEHLHHNRKAFHTKNLKSFVGYAKRQAAKYGVKGSRLAAAKDVLRILLDQTMGERVNELHGTLPENEHCRWMETGHYEVCGKRMDPNSYAVHYAPMLTKYVNNYGARAAMAEQNKGVDWKAVSHAFRAAFQVHHILSKGDFTYPLEETPLLIDIKAGKLDFVTEVSPALDVLISGIEDMAAKSTLPERVPNMDRWFDWAAFLYQGEVLGSSVTAPSAG